MMLEDICAVLPYDIPKVRRHSGCVPLSMFVTEGRIFQNPWKSVLVACNSTHTRHHVNIAIRPERRHGNILLMEKQVSLGFYLNVPWVLIPGWLFT